MNFSKCLRNNYPGFFFAHTRLKGTPKRPRLLQHIVEICESVLFLVDIFKECCRNWAIINKCCVKSVYFPEISRMSHSICFNFKVRSVNKSGRTKLGIASWGLGSFLSLSAEQSCLEPEGVRGRDRKVVISLQRACLPPGTVSDSERRSFGRTSWW